MNLSKIRQFERKWAGVILELYQARLFRCAIHIPHGLIAYGLLLLDKPIGALIYTVVFLYYEQNEDCHIKDQAWLDVTGYLAGFIIMFFLEVLRWIVLAVGTSSLIKILP